MSGERPKTYSLTSSQPSEHQLSASLQSGGRSGSSSDVLMRRVAAASPRGAIGPSKRWHALAAVFRKGSTTTMTL